VFGDDLDRAVIADIHDAAANRLAVEQVDEDVAAWSPTPLGIVHVDQDARPVRLQSSERRSQRASTPAP